MLVGMPSCRALTIRVRLPAPSQSTAPTSRPAPRTMTTTSGGAPSPAWCWTCRCGGAACLCGLWVCLWWRESAAVRSQVFKGAQACGGCGSVPEACRQTPANQPSQLLRRALRVLPSKDNQARCQVCKLKRLSSMAAWDLLCPAGRHGGAAPADGPRLRVSLGGARRQAARPRLMPAC